MWKEVEEPTAKYDATVCGAVQSSGCAMNHGLKSKVYGMKKIGRACKGEVKLNRDIACRQQRTLAFKINYLESQCMGRTSILFKAS